MNEDSRSENAFQRDKPGTDARSQAEAEIEALRQRGGVFVEAVRATRMPMVLTDPNLPGNPIVFANEAFLKLSGYSMNEVLGQQPHFMNGSGTDPKDAPRLLEMLRSEQDEILETVQYRKDGSLFVATVLLSAFKDDEGRVLNHFLSFLDVTRRVAAEEEIADLKLLHAALRESEAKYRLLFNSIDEGFCIIEMLFDEDGNAADYVFLETNPAFERQTGIVDAVGKRMRDIAPDHEQHWFDIYGRIALTGEPERFEQPAEALGRYYDVYAFRVGAPEQNQVAVLFNDIGERQRAETALQESEERYRLIVENARYASIFTIDAEGKVDDWHEGAATIFGYSADEIVGKDARILFTEEDRAAGEPEKEMETAARTGKADNVRWHLRKDGSLVFIEGVSTALKDGQGKLTGFLKVGLDATARRSAQEHERTLLAELQHRVRNTLAVIRSIVRRTGRTAGSVEEFEQHLEGRLGAFARTQAYVTRDPEGGIDLELIIRDELVAHAADGSQHVSIEGPAVRLTAKQAETLGLAVHELTANAIKHGALSGDGDRIDVRWSVRGKGDERKLDFRWKETLRGRNLEQPERSGFGTELLDRVMRYDLDAEPCFELKPGGLDYRVVIPLGQRPRH